MEEQNKTRMMTFKEKELKDKKSEGGLCWPLNDYEFLKCLNLGDLELLKFKSVLQRKRHNKGKMIDTGKEGYRMIKVLE